MLSAGTYRGRLGEKLYETEMPRAGEIIDLGGRMQTQYPFQTVNLGQMHTAYPLQTLRLGAVYGGDVPFGTRPYASVRGIGQMTGEEIDAAEAPQPGERLYYKRQAEGDLWGAILGAGASVAYLTSQGAKRADAMTRAFTAAAMPVAALFAGRFIRQSMPRGYGQA